jgi:hypothetical protein
MVVEVGAGADVDAVHRPVVTEAGGQAGVGASRPVGHHHQVEGRVLVPELDAGLHVPQGTHGAGSSDGDGVRAATLVGQPPGSVDNGGLEGEVVEVADGAGPHDVGPEKLVEEEVSRRHVGAPGVEHDRAGQAQPVGGGCGHAHVVALAPAAGHEGVAALGEGVGAEVLELARLVASARQPGDVVTLDPEAPGRHPEVGPQTIEGLERRGQVDERDAPVQRRGLAHGATVPAPPTVHLGTSSRRRMAGGERFDSS